jgi:hypothetical protein
MSGGVNTGGDWTEAEDATLTRLRNRGCSYLICADLIAGRDAPACRLRWQRLLQQRRELREAGQGYSQASGTAAFDGPQRADDSALVAQIVAEGGFPMLSERVGTRATWRATCWPMLWPVRDGHAVVPAGYGDVVPAHADVGAGGGA